jgi:hypothetical protein
VRLIFDRANLLQKPVDFETIADKEQVFGRAAGLLSGPDVSFSIGLNIENSKPLDELFNEAHGLSFAGWIEIDRTIIAYVVGAKAQLKALEGEYSLECSTTGDTDVSVVGDASAYESIIEAHYRRHGSRLKIAADTPEFTNTTDS